MGSFMEKLGTIFSAAAFAEAGEHETAMVMVGVTPSKAAEAVSPLESLSRHFTAAAFAEADCHDMAREVLSPAERKKSFAEVIGLKGVRVWRGLAPASGESFLDSVGLAGVKVKFAVIPV